MTYNPIPANVLNAVNARGALLPVQFRALVEYAEAWKPGVGNESYDAHQVERRLLYEGKQRAIIDRELSQRYPATWRKMPRVGPNVVKLVADINATTMDRPGEYWVSRGGSRLVASESMDDAGNIVAPDPTALAFERLLELADLNSVMVEAERRVMNAFTLFFRYGWDDLEGRPRTDPYWPSDVLVVPHPSRPSSLRHALAVMFRCASIDPEDEVREVWRRETDVAADGSVSFGRVTREVVTKKLGTVVSEPYAGGLPVSVWHNGYPELPYMDMDRDVVEAQKQLTVGWIGQFFTIDMQAHDELVRIRKRGKHTGGQVVGGPGAVWDLEEGESLQSIARNPKLAESLSSLDAFTRVFAKTQRQPEDAYAKDHTAPLTGVSRQIKNAPYDKASRERAHFARVHIEQQLLPRLVEVSDLYGGTDINKSGDLTFHFAPGDQKDFEDPTQRDQRVNDAVDRGEISQAKGAVLKGWYVDEQAAHRAGLSTALKHKQEAPQRPDFGIPQPEDDDGTQGQGTSRAV